MTIWYCPEINKIIEYTPCRFCNSFFDERGSYLLIDKRNYSLRFDYIGKL